MLISLIIDFRGSEDDNLPNIEVVYNNSYHSSLQITPYGELYGHKYRSSVGFLEVGEKALIGLDFVQDAIEKVKLIRDILYTALIARNPIQM